MRDWVCEGAVSRDSADNSFEYLADWKATVSRKKRKLNFDQTLERLRAHSFEAALSTEIAGGVLVSKYGAGAVLRATADKEAPVAIVVKPGALAGGQVARLVDRGHQKFIQTSQFEFPATASHLHAIHRFSEELKQITGAIDLYNESLGTTSDLYVYDRLKGREAAQPDLQRPWDLAEVH
jgi:hypothetical protein